MPLIRKTLRRLVGSLFAEEMTGRIGGVEPVVPLVQAITRLRVETPGFASSEMDGSGYGSMKKVVLYT